MKKTILAVASILVLSSAVQAQTVINVTGATAFRSAAINTIRLRFVAGGNHSITSDNTTLTSATRVTFIGTFPTIAGTTTVNCFFSGSTEGLRDVSTSTPVEIYDPGTASNFSAPANPATVTVRSSATPTPAVYTTAVPRFSFSDVRQQNSPYSGLLPNDPRVGTIVFTPLKNDSAPAGLTGLNKQSWTALLEAGSLPLRFFTGVTANVTNIYVTGRNDGSGTRAAYLLESGLRPNKLVKQYVVNTFAGDVNTIVQFIPQGGGNAADQTVGSAAPGAPIAAPLNASTTWGQDTDGNGGYFTGGELRGIMGKQTNNTQVIDETGAEIQPAGSTIGLVTVLSVGDAGGATGAKFNGATLLSWNGVLLDLANANNVLSTADRDKIKNGVYTAWNYQNLYHRSKVGDLITAQETAFRASLVANIPANIGSAGLTLTEMNTVSRANDGSPVGL